ncbi:D-alanine--D-alanine ligase [Puteibacter caeruleilacunae]|nr:D-alanine--D-alanine ligase [Puteibacter caeruleilacunae]
MKCNIAVIVGGDSSEYVVSVKSGANVLENIDTNKFTPWKVMIRDNQWNVLDGDDIIAPVDRNDFSFELDGKRISFDYAYIMIHGTPGEDGLLQGYFEMVNVPYSTCDVTSSALTFNKFICNNYLGNQGIKLADSVRLFKGDKIDVDGLVKKLGLPMFVKPNAGGSSFGVTKVTEPEQIVPAFEKAWEESDEVLAESLLEGNEFTCGLVKLEDNEYIFPVTEVIPKNEFFDFEAKYVASMAEEITPARISPELTEKCQQLSSRIYDMCGCNGIVRIDYILKDDEFYFLEVNTTPGMTATSFIPQQIRAMKKDLTEMLSEIIEDGLKK